MITFDKTRIGYGEKTILIIEHLKIPQGSVLPVIGRNGAGKSTLLHAVFGRIPTDGMTISGSVAYQPQKTCLFHTSCENNLLGAMPRPDKQKALQWLMRVGLEAYARTPATRLSGGEGARLALARTLVVPADIYLLDEPFASVDEASAGPLADLLLEHCRQSGATLLMPVHNFSIAARISASVLLIHDRTARITRLEHARSIYQSQILEGSGLC